MNTSRSTETTRQRAISVVSLITGALAVALSVGGQLLAAHRWAVDRNSGHASVDQSTFHLLAVSPSLVLSLLVAIIAVPGLVDRERRSVLLILGFLLGVIAVSLTIVNFPGGLALELWLDVVPDASQKEL